MLKGTRLGFTAPEDVQALKIVQRLDGDASTDFGVPGTAPNYDSDDVSAKDQKRLAAILRACWRAFDDAIEAAHGKQLKSGPRGGGRNVSKIADHVLDAEGGYLHQVDWKLEPTTAAAKLEATRDAVIAAFERAARGEVEPVGPRGGKRWSARYFIRRTAWHTLDHAWEIEDRLS